MVLGVAHKRVGRWPNSKKKGGPDEWRGGKLKLWGGRASFAWPFSEQAELGVPSHPVQAFHLVRLAQRLTRKIGPLSMDQTTGVVRGARGAVQTAREGGRRES